MTEKIDIALLKRPENKVYKRSSVLTDNIMHYCPGCTHGVVHKVLAEEIEKLGIQEDVIGVSPVGCAVLAYNYIDIDWHEAAHGRAPPREATRSPASPCPSGCGGGVPSSWRWGFS